MITEPALKDLFLDSGGQPIHLDGDEIIQMDRIEIPENCEVTVTFVGERVYENNAAVIAVRKPGRIFLSDGSAAIAVAIWDAPDLPRTASHRVESGGHLLNIYNKYRLFHSREFVSEDSFTGNAGMIVSSIDANRRRYQCSNGENGFSPSDLVFEVSWR